MFWQFEPISQAFKSNAEPKAVAPAVTATKTVGFAAGGDADSDGKADPGDTLQYSVTIQNTGADPATGVVLNDTLQNITSSVSNSVNISPLAANDSYNTIGNVNIVFPDGTGDLLSNDADVDGGTITMTGFGNTLATANQNIPGATITTTNGGSLTVNAKGSFNFNPSRGGTDTSQVAVAVSGKIWFVNNAAGACSSNCDGRLTNPYTSITAFQTANNGTAPNPTANDFIFLHTGGANYNGGVTLLNNQKLIGQGATASLLSITGFIAPSGTNQLPATNGTRTVIANTAGTAITLNSGGNTIRGLNAGGSTFAIDDNGAVGTLTISEMLVNSAGGGFRTDAGGTLAVTLDSITTAGGANGINLNSFGAGGFFAVTGAVTISNTTADSINLNNNSSTFNVGGLTQINSTADNFIGIHMQNGSGAITFANIEINGRRDKGIRIASGSRNIATGAVDIDNTNSDLASAIEVLAPSGGTYSFGDTDIANNNVGVAVRIDC